MTVVVTKLHRSDHGELEARLTVDGVTVPVTRRFGSWMIRTENGYQDVLKPYKFVLADRAKRFERGEK